MDGTLSSPQQPDIAVEVRHLAMLDELAEMGMEVARELKRRIVQPENHDDPVDAGRLGVVFTRVARAVRQTVAIHSRMKRDLAAEAAKPGAEAVSHQEAPSASSASATRRPHPLLVRTTVERIVEDCIRHEARRDRESQEMYADLSEKLDVYEAYDWFEEKPVGEMIGRLCQDLGIDPGWARHLNEPWAIEEMRDKPKGSPYAKWRPPEDGDDFADDDAGDDGAGEPGLGRGPPGT